MEKLMSESNIFGRSSYSDQEIQEQKDLQEKYRVDDLRRDALKFAVELHKVDFDIDSNGCTKVHVTENTTNRFFSYLTIGKFEINE